ncbi:MAG: nitrate/sulfonate/bicarbonate ABC transporter ATP-binding protein [Planctomycetota bacterium]|nr:MAG: nitrate/sulfonate/bicarbonate ABC transporter ATP-binding protein [Planctomycetota bacterium]
MDEAILVELAKVGKTYANGPRALDGFSAVVGRGEFVSLLGPSGCGKSTVLRLIAGLSEPSAGVIKRAWTGKRASPGDQPLGCVFQEPTLLPWATVWNNVRLPLALQGLDRSTAAGRVDEALELVGLSRFARAYPRELSGGMKMRVSVARALATHPQLLLLDEPFAALDEITRNRLNDDLLTLWRQRRWAALFITHSIFESVYLSQRVLVMSQQPGCIVDEIAIDLPDERTMDTRTSPRYAELCRRVSHSLERASATP